MSSVNLSFVIGGRGERPLGEKLLNGTTVRSNERPRRRQNLCQRNKGCWRLYRPWQLYRAIELHRLAVEDYEQLEKQKDEITSGIINSACFVEVVANPKLNITTHWREVEWVSHPPLPLLHRSHHCGSHVGSDKKVKKQRSSSSARAPIPTRQQNKNIKMEQEM